MKIRKTANIDLLKLPGTTFKGERVTEAERSRRRRQRPPPALDDNEVAALLEKVARCKDIVNDWDDPHDYSWWIPVFRLFAPPPDLDIGAWALQYRKIPPEFASEPGDWTHRNPALVEPMRACSPTHPARKVVLVKPVQSGGTEAVILNVIGHTIDLHPRSLLVIFPTVDLARSFAIERLDPMIELMPRLKAKVTDVAVGTARLNRAQSSAKKKRFPGGFLNLTGANSSAGLSSRPVPLTLMDEVDECARASGQAGNPIKLLSARTTTFPDRKEIYLSSPSNDEGETGIIQLWEDSSQGWLETQCPNLNCGHWQVLDFDRMDLDSATLACEKCGACFAQWDWNREDGAFERWRFDNPDHPSTAGFRFSGLNSPWLDWRSDLVAEYQEAKRIEAMGDDSLMRVFVNTKLAKPFRMHGQRVETDLYHDRREVYACHEKQAEIPEGVILLTAAVDVQDTYLAYDIVGWGRARESWGIESGEFQGDPHILPDPRYPDRSVWDQIDKFLVQRLLRYEDGSASRIRLIFVDSGGHCTTEVYKFCKRRQPRVFAIKGVGGPDYPMIIGGKVRERAEGCWLLRLGTDTLKDEFHSRLRVEKPGPGYCHWPMLSNGGDSQGYGEGYFNQLVAEQRILKYSKGGFVRYEWQKNRTDANEAFDLRCYSRAALEYLKVRLEQIPRDVLKHLDPRMIERVEVGLGRSILINSTNKQPRSHERQQPRPSQQSFDPGGGGDSPPAPARPPSRSAGAFPSRYGAVSSSF